MGLLGFQGKTPTLADDVFVAPGAQVIGEVSLSEGASVWYNCVLRGDVCPITIGPRTNIQDLTVIHVTSGEFATHIGAGVTVGHRAILHGCTVEDNCLIGMGAILLDGVHVEPDCLIGAGALLTPGTRIPRGSLVLGSPGKVVRKVTPEQIESFRESAEHYVALARAHRAS